MKRIGFFIANRHHVLAFESIMYHLSVEYQICVFIPASSVKSGALGDEYDRIESRFNVIQIHEYIISKGIGLVRAILNKTGNKSLLRKFDSRPFFWDPLFWIVQYAIKHKTHIDLIVTISKETKIYQYINLIASNFLHIALQPLFRTAWICEISEDLKGNHDPVFNNYPADIICVWGEIWKTYLEQLGVTKEIVVTGCPGYRIEGIGFYKSTVGKKTCYGDTNLFYATQPAPWIPEPVKRQIIQDLIRLLEEKETLSLTIKTHPVDSGSIEAKAIEGARPEVQKRIILKHDGFDECLDNCDILLTVHSSSGYWGLLRGKHLLQLNYEGVADGLTDYMAQKVALEAVNYNSLKESIEELSRDSMGRQMLEIKRKDYCKKVIKYMPDVGIPKIVEIIKSKLN